MLNATDEHGTQTPWNDFIHHNSQRPNAARFQAGAPADDRQRQRPAGHRGGLRQRRRRAALRPRRHLPDLARPRRWRAARRIATPLDIINPVKFGDGLSTPIGGFCSAHWFDYHQSGIVAQAYYQQGLRFIDVRDPRDLKQHAYVTGGASEVWDAYWVPQRNAKGVAPAKKTNIVYTTDLVRGLDVYEVDVPGKDLSESGGVTGLLP